MRATVDKAVDLSAPAHDEAVEPTGAHIQHEAACLAVGDEVVERAEDNAGRGGVEAGKVGRGHYSPFVMPDLFRHPSLCALGNLSVRTAMDPGTSPG